MLQSKLDRFICSLENLVVVAQALSLKYPDEECCHSGKDVQAPRRLFGYYKAGGVEEEICRCQNVGVRSLFTD